MFHYLGRDPSDVCNVATLPSIISQDLSKAMDDEGLSLAVSHNGQYFATGGAAAVVKLWGYDDANLIFEGTGHSGVITGLRQVPQQMFVEEAAATEACVLCAVCDKKCDS